MADIKAVHNSMSLGAAPQQQPQQQLAVPEPKAAEEETTAAAPAWDGIERRRGPFDRRDSDAKRPDFLETRHRKDRRNRRTVSVKV